MGGGGGGGGGGCKDLAAGPLKKLFFAASLMKVLFFFVSYNLPSFSLSVWDKEFFRIPTIQRTKICWITRSSFFIIFVGAKTAGFYMFNLHREAVKKVICFSGPATKALLPPPPPPSSLVATFCGGFLLKLHKKSSFFLVIRTLPIPPTPPG